MAGAHFLVRDLAVEEIGVLRVDVLDLGGQSLLLGLEELFVLFPHDGLLVIEFSLLLLTSLLVLHLDPAKL